MKGLRSQNRGGLVAAPTCRRGRSALEARSLTLPGLPPFPNRTRARTNALLCSASANRAARNLQLTWLPGASSRWTCAGRINCRARAFEKSVYPEGIEAIRSMALEIVLE